MTKAALRLEMKRIRLAQDPPAMAAASLPAQARLCALPSFARARRVGLYLARPDEVATARILEAVYAGGREAAVPARVGDSWEYRFCRLRPAAPLRAGSMGIGEPAEPEWVDADGLDFIVVPGVAFDARGRRLGHGRGCYDRLLAGAGRAFKAGLCFEWQMVETVPTDNRDVAMDAVVTDSGLYGDEAGAGDAGPDGFVRGKENARGKG
jgi:5-formyltetrahydrofolate cyclo-ligase